MELTKNQEFAFASIASMSLISFTNGEPTESELEEIYIQIHECERLQNDIDFSLVALDECRERLEINFQDGHDAILEDIRELKLGHDESVEIMNMTLNVVKSNSEIPPEKIDALSEICQAMNLYSDEFNFAI